MVQRMFLSYTSKNECGGVSALSGARLWPVDKILGATAVMRGV